MGAQIIYCNVPLQYGIVLGFHFSIKKVIMKRITKQIKRLRDFSLWGNRWAKNTVSDRERNLKNYINQTGYFVCLLSCNSSLKFLILM